MVIASKTIIQNISDRSECFFLTSTLFTEIQTWYQIQPNYKSLVNLPKALPLRCHSTGRLTPFDLEMCLSNHVSWKQDGFSDGSTINYHTGGSHDISCVCKHSSHDQHWTSVIRRHMEPSARWFLYDDRQHETLLQLKGNFSFYHSGPHVSCLRD